MSGAVPKSHRLPGRTDFERPRQYHYERYCPRMALLVEPDALALGAKRVEIARGAVATVETQAADRWAVDLVARRRHRRGQSVHQLKLAVPDLAQQLTALV